VRVLPFARELYIDRDDYMEAPPKGSSGWSPTVRSACAAAT